MDSNLPRVFLLRRRAGADFTATATTANSNSITNPDSSSGVSDRHGLQRRLGWRLREMHWGGDAIQTRRGSKVRVEPDNREGPVAGNGAYRVNQVIETGAKTISLSEMDSSYSCSCPASCQYNLANIQAEGPDGWNFYVTGILSAWAQVIGGHIYAHSGANISVPAGRYLLMPAGFSNNPGAATKTSGSFTTFPGLLSTTNWNLTDAVSAASWRYSYQRLWVRAGSPTTDPGDGFTPPAAGIYRHTGNFVIEGGGWQGLRGSRVIFVDGNVSLKSKVTLAGSSDFVAIIAAGDMRVDPGVGDSPVASPGPANADLVGAFLANGDVNGGSAGQNDKQLVIYGTIAADMDLNGTGKVRFQRDMGVNNAVGPGVAVIWNPNLLLNWPAELSDALTDWREVAP